MATESARTLIAGNWKMNGLSSSLDELNGVIDGLAGIDVAGLDVALCLPATLVAKGAEAAAKSPLAVGGQDCHQKASGAHTGDISAPMLADAGAKYVVLGHSERRTDHGETDALVADKVVAALDARLIPIICVGETQSEREDGRALDVVSQQIAYSIPHSAGEEAFVVAYEPVWAIGTGLVPTNDDITEMHDSIRAQLIERFGDRGQSAPILYGGSMKPGNAAEILSVRNVNGGLIGGASLKAQDFLAIVQAAL